MNSAMTIWYGFCYSVQPLRDGLYLEGEKTSRQASAQSGLTLHASVLHGWSLKWNPEDTSGGHQYYLQANQGSILRKINQRVPQQLLNPQRLAHNQPNSQLRGKTAKLLRLRPSSAHSPKTNQRVILLSSHQAQNPRQQRK